MKGKECIYKCLKGTSTTTESFVSVGEGEEARGWQ
jgi:hypothetical protein